MATPYRSLSNAAAPSAFRPIGHRAERSFKPVDVARPQPNHAATATRKNSSRRPWSRLFNRGNGARSPSPNAPASPYLHGPTTLRPAPIRRMKTEDTFRFTDRSSNVGLGLSGGGDKPFRMLSSHQFERHSPERNHSSDDRLVPLRPSIDQHRRNRRHSPERRAMPSPHGVMLSDRLNPTSSTSSTSTNTHSVVPPSFGTSSPTLGRAWAPRRQLSAFDSLPSLQARRAQTMDVPITSAAALAVAPDEDEYEILHVNCPNRQCSRSRRPLFWRNPPHAPNCPRRMVRRFATEDEQWKAGYLAGVLASMESSGKRVDSSLKTDRDLLWDNDATTLGPEHMGGGKLTRMMSGRRRTDDKSNLTSSNLNLNNRYKNNKTNNKNQDKKISTHNLRRRWTYRARFQNTVNNDSSDDVMSSVTRGSESNEDR